MGLFDRTYHAKSNLIVIITRCDTVIVYKHINWSKIRLQYFIFLTYISTSRDPVGGHFFKDYVLKHTSRAKIAKHRAEAPRKSTEMIHS